MPFDGVPLPRLFDSARWQHLSTARQVVAAFVQKGPPPVPFRLSATVREVLDCIAALGCHTRIDPSETRATLTHSFWHNHLAPWLTALLLATLAPITLSSTSNDTVIIQFRADVLMYVPFCLDNLDIPFDLTDQSPNSFAVSTKLRYLFVKAWLAVMKEGRVAPEGRLGSIWSSFLVILIQDSCNGELINARTLYIFQPGDAAFFLDYLRDLVSTALKEDLSVFEYTPFLSVFAEIVMQCRHSGDPNGFLKAFNGSSPWPIITRLLTKVLLLRRSLRDGREEDEDDFDIGRTIDRFITAILLIVLVLFDEADDIANAIETGFLSSLLKRPRCLVELPHKIEQCLANLFDLINCSMIVGRVFREFVRAKKRAGSRYVQHLQDAPFLVNKWQSLEEKVQFVGEVRAELKTCGLLYRARALASPASNVAPFAVPRIAHVIVKGKIGRLVTEPGVLPQCRNRRVNDTMFLPRVSEAYLADHATEVQSMMDNFIDALPRGQVGDLNALDSGYLHDLHLVRTKQRNPILIHRLALPGIPAPSECTEVILTARANNIPMRNPNILQAW
ncbi:hypothetical protein PQX77_003203 [Marasmius sp. AFHP31]|nr:hypothetical protein PQX77_015011 [Marasmius sp. AFHP31]KAK1233633.1 hypothetical protein PQX77_003203 [Marasmius sp. AFHP31]